VFTPAEGAVEVRLQKIRSSARLVVRDSGIGIKPELLPRVFDRFWQAEQSRQRDSGLGLGLEITVQLVELHRGAIRVESAGEGRGTTAIVELPLIA
jgi:signal transduction histidine kinase